MVWCWYRAGIVLLLGLIWFVVWSWYVVDIVLLWCWCVLLLCFGVARGKALILFWSSLGRLLLLFSCYGLAICATVLF